MAHKWRGQTVLSRCDNAAVVAIIRSGRSKDPLVMHLMRELCLFTAMYDVVLSAEHIPGKANVAADALKRGKVDLFYLQGPAGHKDPTAIPVALPDILVHNQPDWTSANRRKQCTNILPGV